MRAKEYHDWVKEVVAKSERLQNIQRMLKELSDSGGRFLHFSHHDLDGVASAAIIKVGLEELGAEVHSRLPMGFQLSASDLLQGLKECGSVDAVLVTDRGSDEGFDALTQLHEKMILLDHHPSENPSKRCLWYNPSISNGDQTSAAHLCHILITSLEVSNIYLDFYALLGCRGDFAFDPVTGERGEFVKTFIRYAEEVFPNLFQVFKGRPTRYDLTFRDRTTRINQLAEALNASCFAHSYSGRSPKLSGIYGPMFCFQMLRKAVEERWALQEMNFTDLEEWFQSVREDEILSEVYCLYLEDWGRAMREVDRPVKICATSGLVIYLAVGHDTPLMPLASSVKLHELEESEGEEVLILVFHESSSGVTVSARGDGRKIHCGFLLNALAKRIAKRYEFSEGVSGGGHARAGECIVSTPKIKSEKIMEELTTVIQDITLIDHLYSRGTLPKSGFEKAEELGLRYISK